MALTSREGLYFATENDFLHNVSHRADICRFFASDDTQDKEVPFFEKTKLEQLENDCLALAEMTCL